jgi:hypothetical protein
VSTQKHETRGSKLAAVERSADALGGLHVHVARRFRRPEIRERARRYLAGLLGRVVFPAPNKLPVYGGSFHIYHAEDALHGRHHLLAHSIVVSASRHLSLFPAYYV